MLADLTFSVCYNVGDTFYKDRKFHTFHTNEANFFSNFSNRQTGQK